MRKVLAGLLLAAVLAISPVPLISSGPTNAAAATDCAVGTPHRLHQYEVYNTLSGPAGAVIWRLYAATFLREPEQSGMDYWVDTLFWDDGRVRSMAFVFVSDREFQNRYGSVDNAGFVNLVYRNVMCRQPDSTGFQYWLGRLNSGSVSRQDMMLYFSESKEFLRRTNTCFSLFDLDGAINEELPRCKTYSSCQQMQAAGLRLDFDDRWFGGVSDWDVLYSVNLDRDEDYNACDRDDF